MCYRRATSALRHRLGLDQAKLLCLEDSGRTGRRTDLAENISHMRLCRPLGDGQPLGNLAIPQALGQQPQDLVLTGRELWYIAERRRPALLDPDGMAPCDARRVTKRSSRTWQ